MANVVINEVRTQGPTQAGGASGASDEFIELYNTTNVAIDISGWRIFYRAATGSTDTTVATINAGTMLAAGGYYLLTGAAYSSGSTAASDQAYTAGLAAPGGGLQLRDSAGTVIDSLGFGTATNAFVEGAAAPAPTTAQSITRTNGADTNNNLADFLATTTQTPTSARSSAPANETISVTTAPISLAEGDTGTTAFIYTLTRTGGTAAATVGYSVAAANGMTALDGADFVGGALPTGTATFAANSATATVTINVAGDRTIEAAEGFTLTLAGPSTGYVVSTTAGTGSGTITNDDVAGTISVADVSVSEGSSQALVTLIRSGGGGDTSVNFTTADGTATAAADYQANSGAVFFVNGATAAQISVTLLPDTAAEGNEAFVLNLTPAVGGPTLVNAAATVTILDNDFAVSVADVTVNEGAGTATVTLTRNSGTGDVSIGYATADGIAVAPGDYTATTGTATFVGAATTTSFTVPITDDAVAENAESFTLNLSVAAGNATLTRSAATVTINDNDGTVIPGGTQTATFTANAAGNYTLLAGITRTQTAGVGVTVSAATGPVNVAIDGTLNDTASGQRAIDVTSAVTSAALSVGAAGSVQSLNQDTIRVNTVNGTVNTINLGQILATVTPFTPMAGGVNPGTDFAITYNVAKGAANAPATDYTSGGTITNGSAGSTAALIRSDNGDAIRLGSHETLINYGTINGNGPINDAATNNVYRTANTSVTQTYDVSRGVRLNQANETAVRIENYGTITGAQHGVDMGVATITNVVVTNYAGGQIIGRNGSGVGADTMGVAANTVTVINSGLIRGDRAATVIDRAGYTYANGAGDSDGDGVDIDGGATITNNVGGTIAGNGASGFDSNGRANASEGISIGGGIIINAGTISGADAAIVTNNDSNANGSRSGVAATQITNNAAGSITGSASYAIRLENKTGTAADNDSLVNYGTITGNAAVPTGTVLRQDGTADAGTVGTLDGTTYTASDAGNARFIRGDGAAIQTGEGADTLANYGTIAGNVSARAINMEGGADALTLYTGSSVTGRIDGGAGSDTLTLRVDDRPTTNGGAAGNNSGATTGTLANVINFELLDVASGTWTLAGAHAYTTTTIEQLTTLVIGTGATLSGAIVDNNVLRVNSADIVTIAGAISGNGTVTQAGTGTLILSNAANSYAYGTGLTGGTLDIAVAGAAGAGAIFFASGAQTLRLESAALTAGSFANAIQGFATDDIIDVRGIGLATASYNASAGILTLTGTGSAALTIGTGYSDAIFRTASDNAGGTIVTFTPAPTPTLSISDPSVIEGGVGGTSVLHYVVTASSPALSQGLSFTIATTDGTATAGSDYVARTATGTIAAGQTTYTFDVQITGDTAPERAETVLVNLSAPVNATIADAQGVGIIDNDDGAPGGLQSYFAADFTGFTAAGFAPNPTAAQLDSDVWRVGGLSDNGSPVYGGTYTTGDFARGVIAGSADPAGGGVYSPSANAALVVQPTTTDFENGGFIEAQLVNTTGFTATSFDVAFDWAYRNSGDRADALVFSYSTDGATFVNVPAAAFATPATKDGTAAATTFSLQNETLTIGNVLVGDGNAVYLRWTHTGSTGGGNRDEVGIDNVVVRAGVSDIQTLSATDVTVAEGTGGQSFATFTVTRSSGTGAASVGYATADGTALAGRDYTAQAGTITFAEGERSKTVAVAITTDRANEANETFFLNLTNPVGVTVTDTQARGTITNDDTGPIGIYDIQGAGHVSAFVGQAVATTGIVTAINANSFWLQDTVGDGLFNTSDAVQVFIGAAPTGVTVGDILSLTGTVSEFVPTTGALSVTELTAPSFTVTGHGLVPAAMLIGTDGILPPTNVIDDDRLQVFDPQNDGIDFYEALEGMLVTIEAPIVTAFTDGRATYVVASGGVGATNVNGRGGITLTGDDAAPERIQIFADSTLLPGYTPNHTTGDILGNVTGILTYYSFPELLPTQAVTVTRDVTLAPEQTLLAPDATHLQIASFNIENADPTDPQAKFDAIGTEVVVGLGRPDIIGLQEVQDADGAGAGTDLSGMATAQKVIDAIIAKGGPTYTYIEIAPATTNTSGGEPGGNIRNGYLYNAARVTYVANSAVLIQDPAYNNTRKPLVAQFVFNDTTVTVIDQHSTSRGGSDLSFGVSQPPAQAGDAARTAQAAAIKGYINTLQAADPNAHVVTLGDFNGYYYETALGTLTNDGKLTNLYTLLPVAERYSYVFEGASQAFDNIIVTNNLLPQAQFDVVHYNAEQPTQPITDHDQALASLYIPLPNAAPTGLTVDTATVAENAAAGTLVGTASASDPEGTALTYSLQSNPGGLFAIDATTGRITTAAPLDYEAAATRAVTVRATDTGGAFADKAVAIAVSNVNEAPAGVTPTTATVSENAAAGTLVATLVGNDPDAGDAVSFALATNDSRFVINANQLLVAAGADIDYETQTSIALSITATDRAGLHTTTAVTVAVQDVAETFIGTPGNDTIYGDGGANMISGGAGDDMLFGRGGDDILDGGEGNDLLDGGAGADRLTGGQGNDVYIVDAGDTVIEQANGGIDEVRTALASYTLGNNVENLTFTGNTAALAFDNALNNVITGTGAADTFAMTYGGTDTVRAGAGDDYIFFGGAFTAADKVDGGAGVDVVGVSGGGTFTLGAQSLVAVERLTLFGGDAFGTAHAGYSVTSVNENVAAGQTLSVLGTTLAADESLFFDGRQETDGSFYLSGGAAGDLLLGGQANDTLVGGGGNDQLYGFAGDDYLVGGAGADTLRGGFGRDLFVYQSASDSSATASDHILDLEVSQDQIDLSQIDADTSIAGNQAFRFIGGNAFDGGLGELQVYQQDGHWFAAADLNGDRAADMIIQVDVAGGQPLGVNDFIL